MLKKLYLFRHGECAGYRTGVPTPDGKPWDPMISDEHDPLTKLGIQQAIKLSKSLKNKRIDAFYTSPYDRAFNTAQIVMPYHPESPLLIDKRLVEQPFFFGLPDKPTQALRVQKTLKQVKAVLADIEKTKYENVAITSHGGVTRALLFACGYQVEEIKHAHCFCLKKQGNIWKILK